MTFGRQPQNNGYTNQQYQGNPNYRAQQPYGFNNDSTAAIPTQSAYSYERAEHTSMTRAYGEMAIGLLVTAAVAYLTYASGLLYSFIRTTGSLGWIGLCIVQVVFAISLSAKVMQMKTSTGRLMFYAYAALMGFTLSSVFAMYSVPTLLVALVTSAGFFFSLTMLGLTTKKNMLGWGSILMGALIALIVVQVALLFIAPSNTAMKVIATLGIVLFSVLTMHDAQQTRAIFANYRNQGTDVIERVSILCALNLYLDFVNLFLYILEIFGARN
ncbi:membrane protein [Bombiscardovia apis]|uniref:Membrane protein n=1 Tax=Bombiscardovia apis TaxID=2932182 RepID=A0ABM8BD26_9BIFI|nr:Bax inhibitor-1/YccA family protein [Bombiscardovia apis]BDR54812.1 membrane protein [Bombiscardovia apis]